MAKKTREQLLEEWDQTFLPPRPKWLPLLINEGLQWHLDNEAAARARAVRDYPCPF